MLRRLPQKREIKRKGAGGYQSCLQFVKNKARLEHDLKESRTAS